MGCIVVDHRDKTITLSAQAIPTFPPEVRRARYEKYEEAKPKVQKFAIAHNLEITEIGEETKEQEE